MEVDVILNEVIGLMASVSHAAVCPNCKETWFREERLVELDSGVVIRSNLPVSARSVQERYRYVCVGCGQVLDQPWTGHHDSNHD